jgi:Matrixin
VVEATRWGRALAAAAFVLTVMAVAVTWGARPQAPTKQSEGSLTFKLPGGEFLRVSFLAEARSPAALASSTDAVSASVLAAQPGAVELAPRDAGYAFANYKWPSHSATWSYNPAGKPAGLTGDHAAIAAAAVPWANAGAAFSFTEGALTDAGTGACSTGGDGHNTVGWAPLSGSLLAVTCALFTASPSGQANELEFDTQIDPTRDWSTGGPVHVDLQSVLTHEFGHALGLAHEPDPAAMMYADYTAGVIKRDLTPGDMAGEIALYGQSDRPAATPTPAAVPASVSRPPAKPQAATRLVPLSPGTNFVTWRAATSAPAVAAVYGIQAIYEFDAASGTWHGYFPGAPSFLDTLHTLGEGNSYWIVVTAGASLPVTFTR